jgi:hypothetical protein
MVKARKILYLTDFVESTFAGENAKNSRLGAKMAFNSRRVYHTGFNHEVKLLKSARGLLPKCARTRRVGSGKITH